MLYYVKKEIDGLNGVYQTIAKVTSIDDCLKIYQQFKGLTINFPTKLMSVDYIKQYLKTELEKGHQFSSSDVQQLARSLDYSERQMRRFIAEAKKEVQQEKVEEEPMPYLIEWLQKQEKSDS